MGMATMRQRAERLAHLFGHRCHYCGIETTCQVGSGAPNRLTVDHIVPKVSGGPNGLWNLVISCRKCNNEAGHSMYKCFCAYCMAARVRFEMHSLQLGIVA